MSFGDFFGEMKRRQEFQTKLPQPGLAFLDGAKIVRFCSTRPHESPLLEYILTQLLRPRMLVVLHTRSKT